jgi:hypothetical protein
MTTKGDFEREMGELGEEIDTMVDDGQEEYRQEKANLKEQWSHLDTKRKDLVDIADDAWDDFKDDMEHGIDEVRGAYKDLKRKIGEDGDE